MELTGTPDEETDFLYGLSNRAWLDDGNEDVNMGRGDMRRGVLAAVAAGVMAVAGGGLAAPAPAGATADGAAANVGCLGYWYCWVPDVVGMSKMAATAILEDDANGDFSVVTSTVTVWDSSDGGKVISQNPPAGYLVQRGYTVSLTIGRWGGANR
jgi:hypothetical protein